MVGHTYRPDIDGLRAIAVWLVIVFHLELLPLSGGFVGVDVFFVISGFVISRMISTSMAQPTGFSFVMFYVRRVLRLVPAMLAVTTFVMAVGWFWLGSSDYQLLARSAGAANLFWSNWFFARQAGYFMAEPVNYPLLHTWSLAVEEQFYFFAPFAIVMFSKRRYWPAALAFACLLSLGLAVSGAWRAAPSAYYFTSNRIFEFGIGVALGTKTVSLGRLHDYRLSLGWIGFGLIMASAILIGRTQWFPGPLALPVACGTGLIILAGEGLTTARLTGVNRVLSSSAMVLNGKISYSLYLWHWPLLTTALVWAGRPLDSIEKLILLGGVLLAAVISYVVVEQPARAAANTRPYTVTAVVTAAVAGLTALTFNIDKGNGWPWRLSDDIARLEAETYDKGDDNKRCKHARTFGCLFGSAEGAPVKVLLWGDSHALALAGAYAEILNGSAARGTLIGRVACPGLINDDWSSPLGKASCTAANRDVRTLLEQTPSIRHVVLAGRWALYAGEDIAGGRRNDAGASVYATLTKGALAASLKRTVDLLRTKGITVTLVGPVPEWQDNVAVHRIRAKIRSEAYDHVLPLADFLKSQAFVLETFAPYAEQNGVTVVLPHTAFCNTLGDCRPVVNDRIAYWDANHLNLHGARLLKSRLQNALPRNIAAEID